MNFESLFSSFANLKVAVIGDVMLDTYMWGHVERISPEAPVPVVALHKKELRIGGAGNVALNTVSLGAQTSVITVVGDDDSAKELLQLFQQNNIDTSYCITSNKRITTNKTRIISRNQQMMRLDAETTKDIDAELEDALIHQFKLCIADNKPDVVVLEDYNKGILTPVLIKRLIELCKHHDIITTVDPKRKNFFAFQGVDIFKPNLKEVKEGLNLLIEDVDIPTLQKIHEALHRKLQHQISFITLSEHGVYYESNSHHSLISTHIRNIADVSGAGDTVIAVASVVYAATKNMEVAAQMANIAGGLVCEEVGTAAIDKQRLLQECNMLLSN
jgi:rfaE bifunctional protein kinase chain/domain